MHLLFGTPLSPYNVWAYGFRGVSNIHCRHTIIFVSLELLLQTINLRRRKEYACNGQGTFYQTAIGSSPTTTGISSSNIHLHSLTFKYFTSFLNCICHRSFPSSCNLGTCLCLCIQILPYTDCIAHLLC